MEVISLELEKIQINMQKKRWEMLGMSKVTRTCSLSGTTSAALVAIAVYTVGNGDMKCDGVAVLAC